VIVSPLGQEDPIGGRSSLPSLPDEMTDGGQALLSLWRGDFHTHPDRSLQYALESRHAVG